MSQHERAPLLGINSTRESTTAQASLSESVQPPYETAQISKSFFRETIGILASSGPVILAYTLQNSIQTASVIIVGQLGSDELSAAAFAMMLAMVTAWCIALGGTTAIDTLGSQAFTGSKASTDVSAHFLRCLLLLNALLVPVMVLWATCRPILLLLGQEERLSENVQNFLRVLIIGAPGYVSFEALKKYLQCQGIMNASTYVLFVTSPLNIVLNIVLIHKTPLGFLGSPIAMTISYWTSFLLLTAFTAWSPTHEANKTWGNLDLQQLCSWEPCWQALKLAVSGIIMVATEWWAFEIIAIAAGKLGTIPLGAQSVIMTTDQILNTIPFGIGVAASQRVGNLIGAGDTYGANKAAHASALLSAITGSVVMVLLLVLKDVYGYIFSDELDVVMLVAAVMPFVASFQVADGLAASCGGVLRGQGRQHLGAFFNIIAYYVLALPLGITLAFSYSQGLRGLWLGQVVALFVVGLSEYMVVWLGTDWNREVEAAKRRLALEHQTER